MGDTRIDAALSRIDAAFARLDRAREASAAQLATAKASQPQAGDTQARDKDQSGSARVMALVNSHEKLREEVADTLGDLDELIADLEERASDA